MTPTKAPLAPAKAPRVKEATRGALPGYSIAQVTEGPFKDRFVVSRGDVVNAVFGTRAAAKRYIERAEALTKAMR